MAEGTANTESNEKKRIVYLELKLKKISPSEIVEIEPDISGDKDKRTIAIDFSNAEKRFLELVKKAFLQGKDWNTFTNLNKLVVKSRRLFRDVSITAADGSLKLEYVEDRTEELGVFNEEIENILNDCVHGSQESCYKNALKEIYRRYGQEFVHKNDSEIKIDEKKIKEEVAENVFMEFFLFFLKRAFLYLEKPDSYHIDCPEIHEGESFTESFLRASVEMKRFFCGTVTTGNSSNRGCFLLTGESLSPITVSQDENNNSKCKLDKKVININDIKTISFDSPAMCFRECCAYILSPQKISYTGVFADFFRIKNRSFNKSCSDGDEPENKIIFDIAFYQWFRNRLRQLGLLGEEEQPAREHIFKYFDCVLFYLKNSSDGLKEKDVDKLREIIDEELGNLETDTEERELKFSDLINNHSVKAIIIFLETLLANFGMKTRNSDLINKIKNCMNVECKGDVELGQLRKLPECVLGKNQALLNQNGTLNIDNCRKLLSFLMIKLRDWRARHSSLSAEDNSAGDNRESYGPLNEYLYKKWEKDGRKDESDNLLKKQNNEIISEIEDSNIGIQKKERLSEFLDNLDGNLEEVMDMNRIPSLIDVIRESWNDIIDVFQNNQERILKVGALMEFMVKRNIGLATEEDVELLIDLCDKLIGLAKGQELKGALRNLKKRLSGVLEALIRDRIKGLLRKEKVVKTLLRLFPLLLSQDIRSIIQGNERTEWTVEYKLGKRVLSRFTVEMGGSEIEIKGTVRNNQEQKEEQDNEDVLFFYLTCPFISWVRNDQDYKALSNIMLNLVNRGTRRSVLTYERKFLKKLSFTEKSIHYNGIAILNVEGL